MDEMTIGIEYYTPTLSTVIYDKDNNVIGEFSNKKKYWTNLSNLPSYLIDAFVCIEDSTFYKHTGISPTGILRAIFTNFIRGKVTQGASTITQQLARNMYLNQERTFSRKFREVILAILIEFRYSKEKILELYLNTIFLGNNSYGIEAAAQNYFHKSSSKLTIAESTLLAGLPKAPSKYSPNNNYLLAKSRQKIVLRRMAEEGKLHKSAIPDIESQEIKIYKKSDLTEDNVGYFISTVKSEILKMLEINEIENKGLKIYTTLNTKLQRNANNTVKESIARHISESELKKAELQGAIISINPENGAVLSLVGGKNFHDSQFNRATLMKRNPGNLLLPLLNAIAIDEGIPLSHTFPFSSSNESEKSINIKNGPYQNRTIYEGLLQMDFFLSEYILNKIGIGSISNQLSKLGLKVMLYQKRPFIFTQQYSLFDIVKAYLPLANQGRLIQPYLIEKIISPEGKILYSHRNNSVNRIFTEQTAYILTKALKDATSYRLNGTINSVDNNPASFPGSSFDLHDGWHISYSEHILTGIWVGSEKGKLKISNDTENIYFMMDMASSSYYEETKENIRQKNRTASIPNGIYFKRTKLSISDGTTTILPYNRSSIKELL
ncbi:MAG: transglycosylase domain-containing protein [Oligoflexales bacterium]|nr:transglycosylase domain-containing protein [Oligoflexales bacterium]